MSFLSHLQKIRILWQNASHPGKQKHSPPKSGGTVLAGRLPCLCQNWVLPEKMEVILCICSGKVSGKRLFCVSKSRMTASSPVWEWELVWSRDQWDLPCGTTSYRGRQYLGGALRRRQMPWQSQIRVVLTDFFNMGIYVRKSLWMKIFAICCHVKTFCIWRMQNIPTGILTCNIGSFWIHRLHRPQILKYKNVLNLTFNYQFCWTYADRVPLVGTIFEIRRRRYPQGFLNKEFLTPGYSLKCDVVMCWSNPSRGQHQVVVVREQLHFTERGLVKNYVLIPICMNKNFMKT